MFATVVLESGEVVYRPGIGDPTLLGWLTVVAYAVAAVLAARAAWRGNPARAFYVVLTIGVVALGLNKQLDLQTYLAELARVSIRSRGLYQRRRELQAVFVAGVAVVAVLTVAVAWRLSAKGGRPALLALVGVVLLSAFVLVRAASFHHVDEMLTLQLGSVRLGAVLELAGISCVAVAAARAAGGKARTIGERGETQRR